MKKKRKVDDMVQGSWMASYGDMVTLLLCFFVLLFAMSTLDAQKWKALSESIKESFGNIDMRLPDREEPVPESIAGEEQEELEGMVAREEALQQLRSLKESIDAMISAAGLDYAIQTEVEEVGLVIRMCTDEILFDLGSAELKPMAISFLDSIAGILASCGNEIWVEGHTDDIPIVIGNRYPSNWEVSTARASSVVRYLTLTCGLLASRMKASGFADTKPRFPNDCDEHRYLNRRVEIVIKPLCDISVVYQEWKDAQRLDEGGSE